MRKSIRILSNYIDNGWKKLLLSVPPEKRSRSLVC